MYEDVCTLILRVGADLGRVALVDQSANRQIGSYRGSPGPRLYAFGIIAAPQTCFSYPSCIGRPQCPCPLAHARSCTASCRPRCGIPRSSSPGKASSTPPCRQCRDSRHSSGPSPYKRSRRPCTRRARRYNRGCARRGLYYEDAVGVRGRFVAAVALGVLRIAIRAHGVGGDIHLLLSKKGIRGG